MMPIEFEHANQIFTMPPSWDEEVQGEGGDLHVLNDGDKLVSCWQLSFWERLQVLIFGTVWLYVWSQDHPVVGMVAGRMRFKEVDGE